MFTRRTDIQMLAVFAILVYTLVQISGEDDSGDTTSLEPAAVGGEETESIGEESLSQTPPVPAEEEEKGEEEVKGEEEEPESDDTTSKVAVVEELEPTTTKTPEAETQATTSEKFVPNPEPEIKKEEAPPSTFPVWNSNRKICLLAKFKAEFRIKFQSKEGEQTVVESLPEHARPRGECGGNKNRTLHLSWDSFVFIMTFSKIKNGDSEEKWAAKILELLYDTSEPPFDSAINGGKITARSEDLQVFKTPFGKSYSCPSQVVKLYNSKNEAATVRFEDMRLQPFRVEHGKFSPSHQCVQEEPVLAIATEEPFVRDETVPLAVGLTLAILTLLVVLGFSIYRAYTVRKVDYNSME